MSASRGGYGALPSSGQRGRNPFEDDDEPYSGFGGYDRNSRTQAQRPSYGYQDNTNQYKELSDEISSNIFRISSNSQSLDRASKQIGTNKDSDQLRDRIHETEQQTNAIISKTANAFREMARACKAGSRHEGLQFERLKSEFRETVMRYNNFQKKVAAKVKSAVVLQSHRKEADLMSWEDEASTQQQQQRQTQISAGFDQLADQEQIVDNDLALMRDREERIHQLESDILDINEIFRELGTLVHEQGEVIDTIESNVENAANYVESGNEQLLQAAQYQRKSRKKKCILVGILAGVLAVIVIIIVVATKH